MLRTHGILPVRRRRLLNTLAALVVLAGVSLLAGACGPSVEYFAEFEAGEQTARATLTVSARSSSATPTDPPIVSVPEHPRDMSQEKVCAFVIVFDRGVEVDIYMEAKGYGPPMMGTIILRIRNSRGKEVASEAFVSPETAILYHTVR